MHKVEVGEWRQTLLPVAPNIVAYMGRRLPSGDLELWVRTSTADLFKTEIAANQVVPSLIGLFPAADFHEREIAQLLGAKFDRPVAPLYCGSAAWVESETLRPELALAQRNQSTWPGAKEPGETNSAGKRRLLPPGVDPATPAEHLI